MTPRWLGRWVPDPFQTVMVTGREAAPRPWPHMFVLAGAAAVVMLVSLVTEVPFNFPVLSWAMPLTGLAMLEVLPWVLPTRLKVPGPDGGTTPLYLSFAACAALSVAATVVAAFTHHLTLIVELGLFVVAVPLAFVLASALRVASRPAVRARLRAAVLGSAALSLVAVALGSGVEVASTYGHAEAPVASRWWLVAPVLGVALFGLVERHLARIVETYGDAAAWREATMDGRGNLTFREGGAPRVAIREIAWLQGPVVVIPRGGGESSLYRGDGAPHAGWVCPGTASQLRSVLDDTRVSARALSLAALWLTAAPLWSALILQLLR